ncbi:MAG: hypothetical protein JO060_06715, partial [Candidatus Eremiobacteraeota bacterium]|nr:hypothetical protein [Candidatus Eremiobacteraeota bacterium]
MIVRLLSLVAACALAFPAHIAEAAEAPIVQVRIPQGLTTDFVGTQAGPNGSLYVTIPSIRAFNPNSHDYGPYEPDEFHLIVDGHTFYPVVRPGLGAIDLSTPGIVPPKGSLLVTVTFKVPAGTKVAEFEFVPHWFDDNGGSVAFC